MRLDRSRLEAAWRRAFGETLEQGIERVRLLVKRFGVFTRFEQATGGGRAFDATRTTISDSDFARVAILACGLVELIDPVSPDALRLVIEEDPAPDTKLLEQIDPVVVKPGETTRGHAGPTCGTASSEDLRRLPGIQDQKDDEES